MSVFYCVVSNSLYRSRAIAPTPTSQAMAGLVFTRCANLSTEVSHNWTSYIRLILKISTTMIEVISLIFGVYLVSTYNQVYQSSTQCKY